MENPQKKLEEARQDVELKEIEVEATKEVVNEKREELKKRKARNELMAQRMDQLQ